MPLTSFGPETTLTEILILKDMQSGGKYASSCPGTSDGVGDGLVFHSAGGVAEVDHLEAGAA